LAQIGGARAGSSARSARHARLLELVNQGQSVAQIAAALGVGETCVFRDLQKLRGVVPDVPLGANARRVQASQQRRAKVADLAARGHDTGAIAAALGVTPRRVVRDLYEARHED
jgi:predicted transcriptional regulator